MTVVDLFFWVILPYIALTTFLVGHAWRWRHDQFGWTSLSTQLQERRLLKWGSPLFHYGTLAAVAGHVIGILVPDQWTSAVGISERAYHDFSAWAGTAAIVVLTAGLLILLYRRLSNPRIRTTTSHVDVAVYLLLLLIIALGIAETIGVNLLGAGYDYRPTVGAWFRGIFAGRPHQELMATAPLLYQVHAICAWFLFMLWPFSRLVHAWSYPIAFLWRPYIAYRRRFPSPQAAAARRAAATPHPEARRRA